MRIAVAGAGGAIGGHLVRSLLDDGHEVYASDKKHAAFWLQWHDDAINLHMSDLDNREVAYDAFAGCEQVYLLAADMGGMGFLDSHRVATWHSVDVTSSMLWAAARHDARVFYASSACVYPDYAQQEVDSPALKESDAWPADPEPCYGMEKLYGEEGCKWYAKERGLVTRVARYHNVYSTFGTFDGGREKFPAAATRKMIAAKRSGDHTVEIWGDGEQTRSYMWIDDCVYGTKLIMNGDYDKPLNLGRSELVSVNDVYDMLEEIAGIEVRRTYNLTAPQGVRGRNSDNTLIKKVYGWEPRTSLREGLEKLYAWIWDEMIGDRKAA
jgi:nucleoside-diphosphate-sugar epimerase